MHELTRIAVFIGYYDFETDSSISFGAKWYNADTNVGDVLDELETAWFTMREDRGFSIFIHAGGSPVEYALRYADVGLTLGEVHEREADSIREFRAIERGLCNEIPF